MVVDRTVTTRINKDLCDGCGNCVDVCPSQCITIKNGRACISGNQSLRCGHCAAACPVEAIRVEGLDSNATSFNTFLKDDRWLPHGVFDVSMLVRLMRSRRSCRNYTDKPVSRYLLEDLVKIGITAPSGSNCQRWSFTILPSRREVVEFGNRIVFFFKRLNRMAGNRFVRFFLKLLGKNRLDWYYREYYDTVEESLAEWTVKKNDRLFHGATAAIIVGSCPGASCPKEDAMLATQNILLATHSIGLGSCLIGFAVEAIKNDQTIKRSVNIPDEETVYAVIALGYPKENYLRTAGRKAFKMRFFDLSK